MGYHFSSEVNALFYTTGMTALAASNDIHLIMEKSPKGYVHSVFNSSFNLAFGEHLVHIGALENGLAPFGIGMDPESSQLLTKLLRVNEEVFWDDFSKSIVFPKGITLSLSHVDWTNLKLEPFTYELSVVKDNFMFIAEKLLQDDWHTGLGETEEEKKRIIRYLLEPELSTDSVVLDKLKSLESLVYDSDGLEAEKVFDYWIGRGLGLTPSGDDCITGMCAVLSAFEGTDQSFIQYVKSYLAERGRKRTTHIALEYLLYATENKFHSHLLGLCYVMNKPRGSEFLEALEEMKKIGHTSGADTLVGVLLGIKAAVYTQKKGDSY